MTLKHRLTDLRQQTIQDQAELNHIARTANAKYTPVVDSLREALKEFIAMADTALEALAIGEPKIAQER